jgi:hypothetical protein
VYSKHNARTTAIAKAGVACRCMDNMGSDFVQPAQLETCETKGSQSVQYNSLLEATGVILFLIIDPGSL